jgi:hypothetical protein
MAGWYDSSVFSFLRTLHGVSFLLLPCFPDLTGLTGGDWRCRRTKIDKQAKCVGHSHEVHNSLITSFLYYSLHLLCFFSSLFFKVLLPKSFFKTLLLFYSLKSLSLKSLCPMFSLISLKVSALRFADKQQQPCLKTALV